MARGSRCSRLTTSQHESLDGQLGSLLEELSEVPELLQPVQPRRVVS